MKQIRTLTSLPWAIAFIVCLWLLLASALPAAAAPMAQAAPAQAVSKYDMVNVRSGPSTNYPVVGTLSYGQSCPITGRDTTTGWWLISCSTGVTGWVSYDVVTVVGDTSTVPLYSVGGSAVVAPPEPQAPAQPSTFNGWRASYYANKDLAGAPVLVQDVPEVNFNWGLGSPGPNVPVDYFSARYERTLTLPFGNYMLTLRMDDGARVFIDDQIVLDDWRTGPYRELSSVRTLSGSPRFRCRILRRHRQRRHLLLSHTVWQPTADRAHADRARARPTSPRARSTRAAGSMACPVLQQHRSGRQRRCSHLRTARVLSVGQKLGRRLARSWRGYRLLVGAL